MVFKEQVTTEALQVIKTVRHGYMCRVDFDHEMDSARGGTIIYPTSDDAKECSPCVTSCGMVKVAVTIEEEILPTCKVAGQDIRVHLLAERQRCQNRLTQIDTWLNNEG